MSSKRLSPTANLLRSSRLFSLPPTLARPANEGTGVLFGRRDSDSATLQHPVQQAITVPQSSLARGDWGLKRPLPLRTTSRTSTPSVRLNAIDTIEHITDFDSAADLTVTLNKIQDLALAISITKPRTGASDRSGKNFTSVFEPLLDNTDPDVAASNPNIKRWKYDGPEVSSLSEGEFTKYVSRSLNNKKPEFAAFLRRKHAEHLLQDMKHKARTAGIPPPLSVDEGTLEAAFPGYLRKLRQDFQGSRSSLTQMITEFLDLPKRTPMMVLYGGSESDGAGAGPEDAAPKTHPSAGVSYLKTNNVIKNHPIYGPQQHPTPVEARVLPARSSSGGPLYSQVNVGVAGVVASGNFVNTRYTRINQGTEEERRSAAFRNRIDNDRTGVTLPGGQRYWVEARHATIDKDGKINLNAIVADRKAIEIHTGNLQDAGPEPETGRPNNFTRGQWKNDKDATKEIIDGLGRGFQTAGKRATSQA